MKTLSPERLARLTPEKRARYEAELRRVKRNRRIVAVAASVIAAAAVIAVLCFTVLFRITDITVDKPGKIYTPEQIISASGLNRGEILLTKDHDKVSARIENDLPYVLEAKIKRTATGKVIISITDDLPAMIFKVNNGYALTDKNGKTLEILASLPEKNNYIVVKTSKEITAKPGQVVSFADKDEEQLYNEIKTAMTEAGLENITGIDISDPTDIYAEYQHRYRLHVGDSTALKEKFLSAVEAIKAEDETRPNSCGVINLTIRDRVYVMPLDSLDQTELTTVAEVKETAEDSTGESGNDTTEDEDEEDEEEDEDGSGSEEDGSEDDEESENE